MRGIQVRTVPAHCNQIDCRKCRARCRWYRRKAWQVKNKNKRKK
jgi:hypothetical protein